MTESAVPPEIREAAETLWRAAGKGGVISVGTLSGGRNNRVYRVQGEPGTGILKHYFQNADDGRDRFASELAWYRYCEGHHIERLPRLWGADDRLRCMLLEEVPGRKLTGGSVTADHVRQAAEFFRAVNVDRPLAGSLPTAADACFTIRDYLAGVDRRLSRLQSVPVDDEPSQALHEWLASSLLPTWSEIRRRTESKFSPHELQAELSAGARCLSPSDFGFHNALCDDRGQLWFVDFEYAGWDDPAKTVCDFFWQCDIPAPREALPLFLGAVQPFGNDVESRVRALFPLFGVKWCAIVLNEFLRGGRERRNFSTGTTGASDRRQSQLELSGRLLADVEDCVRSMSSTPGSKPLWP